VIAYKFLREGRLAPFSGHVWPEPGAGWVESDGELAPCATGVHACRVRDLPHWIANELWRVELDGDPVELQLKVVARRGRLVERIVAWDEASERFADHCLRRTAHHAAFELSRVGLDSHGEALRAAEPSASPEELAAIAAEAARAGKGGKPLVRRAAQLAEFVSDAVKWFEEPAGVAYIAAHTAGMRRGHDAGIDDPFEHERELQASWLATELGLDQTG
jgi:hypothetical protein